MIYRIEKVVSACDIHYMENLPKYQLIDKDWIINTLELVSNKKITIAKACENAKLIGMNGFFRISTKTFYKSCRFNNIKTNLSRGVAPKMKINEAENIINEYRNNGIIVGLTKMYYIINNGNERKCGFRTIQNIYDKNNWIKHKEKKETIYRCRFEAILVNAIWHVDIHYCKKMPGLMVYGIIDDKSRVLSHNSYKFNALFKKSTTFCICFQLELHFLLAHKKLLTFSIRSQLLLLFLRYIKK